jgi:hypothetical protein
VLSSLGVAPLTFVGGIVGSGLGAAAGIAIRRHPDRWTGEARADTAVAVGLLTGPLLLGLFTGLHAGDWGWWPFAATLAYAAAVGAAWAAGRRGARGAVPGAVVAVLAIVGLLGLAVGVVLLMVFMLRQLGEGIADG